MTVTGCTVHPRLSEPRLSGSSIIRTSQTADYAIVNTCPRMCNLPTFVDVADFRTVRSSRYCGPIAAARFTEAITKSKRKRKGLSRINDKGSIVKQLKSSSVAIIAERYGLKKHCLGYQGDLMLQIIF